MIDLKLLQKSASGLSILYVDDNEKLRVSIGKFLLGIFDVVYVAEDGFKALKKFKTYKPEIVISDLNLQKLNGFKLAQQIKKISPLTKFIILSAHDETPYLHTAISLGVFNYLNKPVDVNVLTKTLSLGIKEIQSERNSHLFYENIWKVFNYQSSMIVMMQDEKPIVANHAFLDFFGFTSIEDFVKDIDNFGQKFLQHDGFLYHTKEVSWLDAILYDDKNSYNVLMKNLDNDKRHFILHYQDIGEKNGAYILSFEDVSELNIQKMVSDEENEEEKESIFPLLELIMKKRIHIELHNYYKGLSITHKGTILKVTKDSIMIESHDDQQKAIRYEGHTLLVCEILPGTIMCHKLSHISFTDKYVELKELEFVKNSPITRKTARVVPKEGYEIKLILKSGEYIGTIILQDISIYALKLTLTTYPIGLKEGDYVSIGLGLEDLNIEIKASLYRRYENENSIDVVFVFDFEIGQKNILLKYVTKRQMATIREFKGLNYEQ